MQQQKSLIIYDGDCMLCHSYVRMVRLREAIGEVETLDARSGDPRLAQYWAQGYDLNDGMLFVHRDKLYFGAEAVHVLALLCTPSGVFNRLNAWIFSSRAMAVMAYPFLRLGRSVALFSKRKGQMQAP